MCKGPAVGDNAPAQTEDLDNQTNDIVNGEVSTGQDVHTVRFLFVCVCIVAWWRDEAHQYPNISTQLCIKILESWRAKTQGVLNIQILYMMSI